MGCDLPQVEFAFNSMKNKSTGKSPFELVYTTPPKYALDLVPLPRLPGMSIAVENLAERVQEVQAEVRSNLERANMKYKQATDKHRRAKVFQEGDLVMIHLRKGRFLADTYDKLQDRKYGPCYILKKISDNAYVIDLLENMSISPTFNVADLFEHHPPDEQSNEEPNFEVSLILSGGGGGGIDAGRGRYQFGNNRIRSLIPLFSAPIRKL